MAANRTTRGRKAAEKAASQPGGRRPLSGGQGKPASRQAAAQPSAGRILDERSRRDIAAVSLIVLAVALFATSFLSPDGVLTGALSLGLKLCLGVGAYVLPFMLAGLAATLLVRFDSQMVPARVAIGFALLFVAFLTIMALFTPLVNNDPNSLFIQVLLVKQGGYLGAGIAWAGLELLGFEVTMIVMVGVVVIAFIIIGFSISSVIEKVRGRYSNEADCPEEEASDGFSKMPRFSIARIKRAPKEKPAKSDAVSAAMAQMPTQAINPSDAVSQQNTQVIATGKKAARTHKTNGQRASEVAGKTLAFQNVGQDEKDAEPRQMTRKLGFRPEPEANQHAQTTAVAKKESGAAPTRKKASDVATPEPLEGFELPDMSLLNTAEKTPVTKESEASLRATGMLLQETLADFGVGADVVGWVHGPTVTLFKVDLPSGVRVNRVSNLTDDIALALAAPGVRIFAPIPGTNYVGIEVPNKQRETVFLGDVIKDAKPGPLQIAIGKDVEGQSIVSDLATMPHLLIGGTTGSGKSVAINGFIMSILMRATPSEVRMIMIDPKRVEFTPYNGIPHLYVPVVTEAREAASALSWAVAEMERRLKVFSGIGARNIGQYNAKVQKGLEINDAPASEMPYIVIIIDELADLMMNVGKEVEFSISRLAQLARAAGIHLIVATQRPSTNVVTGLIKANITNRIAFNVASGIDSRVILDTPGAENLIGLGDLLLSKPELAKPQRIQGCFVSEDEISAVVEKLKSQGEPEYHNDILKTNLITLGDSMPDGSGGTASGSDDPLVWEAAEIVCSSGMGSTSNLQRRLSVGYSRAGRIMDLLEEKGIVGPPNGSKPREVLVDPMELETIKAFEQNDE